jgi:hypothetical protein
VRWPDFMPEELRVLGVTLMNPSPPLPASVSGPTPGPWIVYDDDTSDCLEITCDARDGKVAIATVSIGFETLFDSEQRNNAAFIVRACNAHADLVAALKETRDMLHKLYLEGGGCDHSVGICWCEEQRALDAADAALSTCEAASEGKK